MKYALYVLCILGLGAILLAPGLARPAAAGDGPLSGVKVCLDPGHGGTDPGAVNEAYGLYESHINLDVSQALMGLLVGDGATVELTRYDDQYLTNSDRYTFCDEWQATILVSVHTNSSVTTSMDGSLGLYFHDDDRELAGAIYDVMWPALKANAPHPEDFTGFGLSRFASGVLLKSDMPAAMMEPLFMSYAEEAAMLVQPIDDGCPELSCRRGEIARALHEGILAYFDGQEPPPTPEPGGAMHVAAVEMELRYKGRNALLDTTVVIQDSDGQAVSGALVWVTTMQPDGSTVDYSGTTGDGGSVTFTLRTRQAGLYTSTVTGVQKAGWSYDAGANVETANSLEVP